MPPVKEHRYNAPPASSYSADEAGGASSRLAPSTVPAMRFAVLVLVVAGCAAEANSPNIGPPPTTPFVTVTGPPVLVPATAPPLTPAPTVPADTVTVTEPAPLPAPTETPTTEPAVTEPVPGPESELDPWCPQDPDEIAAGEPPHQPPCD